MTERKSNPIRIYNTDSKVNYGARSQSTIQKSDPEVVDFLAQLYQRQDIFKQNAKPTQKRMYNQQSSRFNNKLNQYKDLIVDPKKLVMLASLIVISIFIYAFDISIQFGPDEDCWQEFKDNNCSFTNPSGFTCRRLLKCISGESWQMDVLYLLIAGLGSWGGFRFRKQLKRGIIKAIQLWQKFLENK